MNRTVRDILLEHKMPRIFLVLASLIVGSLIVITVITTIAMAAPDVDPIPTDDCVKDYQGVNDEPGQKDLTQMCIDYYYDTDDYEYHMSWNWDDTSWPGVGQSGDACSLYDTNGDGLVNYALCVSIENGTWISTTSLSNTAPIQKEDSPYLYSCGNDKPDSCTNPELEADNSTTPISPTVAISSTCVVDLSNDDPFPYAPPPIDDIGDFWPWDTKADCLVDLDQIPNDGPFPTTLIDVCSIPSDSPNSDPSDCIWRAPDTAKLEVVKELIPSDDSGLFLLYIEDVYTPTVGVGNGGTTGPHVIETKKTDSVNVGEDEGTSTDLNDYWKSIVCRLGHGTVTTPLVELGPDESGPLSVPLENEDDIVCVITNEHVPTAVELANFEAKGQIGNVLIEWTTVFETDNDGFNLYRSDSLVGVTTKINGDLIPSESSGEFVMTSYQYMDQGLQMGQTYYYWLESVSASGDAYQFASDSAVPLHGIYLSLVRK